jgi:hypothetical protein
VGLFVIDDRAVGPVGGPLELALLIEGYQVAVGWFETRLQELVDLGTCSKSEGMAAQAVSDARRRQIESDLMVFVVIPAP